MHGFPASRTRFTLLVVPLLLMVPLLPGQAASPVPAQKNPLRPSAPILAGARANFEKNCLRCHGPKGQGDGPLSEVLPDKPVNLTDASLMKTKDDAEIFRAITEGIKWMPGFGGKLSVEERWGMVHYVRTLSSPPQKTADTLQESPAPPRP